ncbi:hypothetical protein CHRY9390_00669 [Chryseobacterium aquaeductus]|uniref:Signal peptidase n=1 Tax=Chryseobacterium aquaeductus TaxID=2675056 RepID=A0A9N8MEC2_9FLAO|nr:hypothetical protein [Chryseobacterium aquaeductus]CAA7330020.1 hypothetical protein CHRY9390_00669 [Chryseobacterium potabilaquae]CAD7800711.1 hypothetical protein CHRY9390_00669 [Chryseobacterium aquaeductus]
MKKALIASFILCSFFALSQKNSNIFTDDNTTYSESQVEQETMVEPGNPGNPAPIDNYIPALMVISILIIIYSSKKEIKKN